MTTIAHAGPIPTASTRPTVWRHGVAAGAVAAVVTTTIAAVASAAGVSFETTPGEPIPTVAFPQLTILFTFVGVALAAVLQRRASRPRSTFVKTAVALTALSVVPDVTFGFDAASAVTLICCHLAAAAIVVPTIARRLVTDNH